MINKIISLVELPKRVFGPIKGQCFSNIEADQQYNFSRLPIVRKHGISAMLRVKNEEKNIVQCITSIIDVFDEIVFIDNGSKDNTLSLVENLSTSFPQIKIFAYPTSLSRCGEEHNNTPENSVKSLAYYYNWCLSKCQYGYIMKWDADMILCESNKKYLNLYFKKLNTYWPSFSAVEIQTIYQDNDDYYLSKGELNMEYMIFPNRADVYFQKGKDFELLKAKLYKTHTISFKEVKIFELKNINTNEFSHWDTESFTTDRKKREFERFNMVKKE